MQRCGLAAQFEHWNRRAARIALEARDRSERAETVCVAGSVSTYGRFDGLDAASLAGHFRAQGELLVDEGVDLLLLETPGSSVATIKAMLNATRELGVPVWVSLSCVRDRATGTLMHGIEESTAAADQARAFGPFEEVVRDIMSLGCSAVLMMHSLQEVTEDAVCVMRSIYPGPVGV